MDQAKNFAKGTVDGAYDDAATSIDLLSGDSARFPTVPFNAVWWNVTDYPDPADDPDHEIVRVTAISTNTLTITRAQEATPAVTHNAEGKTYRLLAGLTAKVINDDSLNITKDGATKVISDDDLNIDVSSGRLVIFGPVGTDQYQSASVAVGTLNNKIPVLDENGDLIGYIPVYSSIT
jgi:hypothetical protein